MVRRLFRLRPIVLLALGGSLLVPATSAFASATVGISGGVLTYTAGAGDGDTPSFQRNTASGDYMYVSSGAGLTQVTAFIGGLCEQIDPTDVRCPTGSYTSILANLGDQADDVHQVAFGPDSAFFRPITLNGDADPDHLEGGNGNDTINGGAGDDVLTAFGGHDTLTGGDGADQFYVEPADSGAHSYDGGPGDDTFTGGAGNETFVGGDGADTIDGEAGNDTIDGGPGPDQMSGDGAAVTGGAFDAVSYQSRTAPVRVTLEESGDPNFAAANDGETGEGDRVAPDIEIVRGGSGADQLFGNSQRNELHGGGGSDAIDGGANNDTLYGDDGSDQITGGPGNDTIVGGPGDDIIDARDGEADSISCGDGADRANVDEFDTVAPDCFEGGGGPGGGGTPGGGTTPPPSAQPPGFATPPPSPSAEAGCRGQVTLGPITALGVCFKKDGAKFIASAGSVGTTVRINGIDLALGSGAKLVLDPQGQSISATGSVQVKVGPIVLLSGAFDWNVKLSPLEFQAGGDTTIAGLPISGKISVKFGGGADLKLSVKLPAIFGGFTGDAAIHVDNALGITLNGLHIAVDHGFLGALEIKNLLLDYQADTKDWKGAVDVLIPTPGRPEIKGSIEVDKGRLVSAMVTGTGLDLSLAPALALQSLDAAVTTTPYFSLSGKIALTAGPKIGNFAALASSGSFFYARGEDIPQSPLIPLKLHGAVIAVDGKIVIVNAITVDGRLLYSPGRIAVSTSVLIGNHTLGLEGSASGWAAREGFSLEGSATVYALGLQLKGTAVLSSKGLAGCAQIGPFGGGVGKVWGQPLKAFAGCDLGPYKPAARGARAAATGQAFQVAAHARGLSLAVHGNGAPPKITVTGPGGVNVSTAADASPTRTAKVIIAQDPETSTTYALLMAPAAGSWKIAANDGSAAITSVERSDALPDPAVTARVTGKGARRVLTWNIKPIPGQKVTFEEDSRQTAAVLATATGGRGTKRFAPAEGVAGRRNIVAIVEQNGLPRETIVVAHYQASTPPGPPKPRRVTLRRRGTSLVITWTPVALAARYAVRVSVSDGRRLILLQPGHRATVPGVIANESATVSVRGLTKTGRQGPAASAKLAKSGKKASS